MRHVELRNNDTIIITELEAAESFLDILGYQCDKQTPIIVIGSPRESCGGVVFLRLSNVEEGASLLRSSDSQYSSTPAIAEESPSETQYCTVCYNSIKPTDDALRLTRIPADEGAAFMRPAHETASKHVWCHRHCTDTLASLLQQSWDNTDKIIGDAL